MSRSVKSSVYLSASSLRLRISRVPDSSIGSELSSEIVYLRRPSRTHANGATRGEAGRRPTPPRAPPRTADAASHGRRRATRDAPAHELASSLSQRSCASPAALVTTVTLLATRKAE